MLADYDEAPGWPAEGCAISTPDEVPSDNALWSRRFRQRHSDRVNAERRARYRALRLSGLSVPEARLQSSRAL